MKRVYLILAMLCSWAVASMAQTENGHEYVDLGLPSGTMWATCNLGATTPTAYGGTYAWGEWADYGVTDNTNDKNYSYGYSYTKYQYRWYTYKYAPMTAAGSTEEKNWSNRMVTKYAKNTIYWKGTGEPDGKTLLEGDDDAAHKLWGGDWQMPTKEQILELQNTNYVSWSWTTVNGVNGIKVVSKKYPSRSIFLPAAGYRSYVITMGGSIDNGDSRDAQGKNGYYWSKQLSNSTDYKAIYMALGANTGSSAGPYFNWTQDGSRWTGYAVRPVVQKAPADQAPTIANKTITLNATDREINLQWKAATDDYQSPSELEYYVYICTSQSELESHIDQGFPVNNMAPITSTDQNLAYTSYKYMSAGSPVGLKPNTTYYVAVEVVDKATPHPHHVLYDIASVKTKEVDIDLPPATLDRNVYAQATTNRIKLQWKAAVDDRLSQFELRYNVYVAPSQEDLNNQISMGLTVNQGTPITSTESMLTYETDIYTDGMSVYYLKPNTTYYVAVEVYDQATPNPNYTLYNTIAVKTQPEADPEARIGSTTYAKFSQAIAAAKENDKVELLTDVQLTELQYIETDGITIDLCGHTVSADPAYSYLVRYAFCIAADRVTIKNGRVKWHKGIEYYIPDLDLEDKSTCIYSRGKDAQLQNLELTGADYTLFVHWGNVKASQLTDPSIGLLYVYYAEAELTDCQLGDVELNSAEVTINNSTSYKMLLDDTRLQANNLNIHPLTGYRAIESLSSHVTLNGKCIISGDPYGFPELIKVSNGQFNAEPATAADLTVADNGLDRHALFGVYGDAEVNILGGTLKADGRAFHLHDNAKVNVGQEGMATTIANRTGCIIETEIGTTLTLNAASVEALDAYDYAAVANGTLNLNATTFSSNAPTTILTGNGFTADRSTIHNLNNEAGKTTKAVLNRGTAKIHNTIISADGPMSTALEALSITQIDGDDTRMTASNIALDCNGNAASILVEGKGTYTATSGLVFNAFEGSISIVDGNFSGAYNAYNAGKIYLFGGWYTEDPTPHVAPEHFVTTHTDNAPYVYHVTDATAIQSLATDAASQPAYNLQGQRVSPGYKGIVVKNGRKTLR